MVEEKVIELLKEKVDAEDITRDTKFADLGIDSLDVAELVMNIEDEFDIEMEMDQSLTTVGAVVDKINEIKG
ncbi:MAG: phosphopantetheine-binding protein [Acutalibacteraceae bacterium]|nr:phosphopantetheine-binding protein [Acutalibacteraceae bacterium]